MKRFEASFEPNEANYEALSPLSFMRRAEKIYGERLSMIDDHRRFSWAETGLRCRKIAGALQGLGLNQDDVVAIIAPNIPAMYEAHFAVPLAGAVLATLNIRLDAAALAYVLGHSKARVLFFDAEYDDVVAEAIQQLKDPPRLIAITSRQFESSTQTDLEYEELLERAAPLEWRMPSNEWNAISLNYTSGTTGNPKGVIYHHRGAYLNALDNIVGWSIPRHATYLWSLPMFHCNGWCFPWTIAAIGGVNVCLRRVSADKMLSAIKQHGVTHMCGAPIVYSMLLELAKETGASLHGLSGQIAGSAPPPATIQRANESGLELTHVYGLTEVYGPAAICEAQPDWEHLDASQLAQRVSRQGFSSVLQSEMRVLDPLTMEPVLADGENSGEIMFRGNLVMKGYLDDPEATRAAFSGGWFHTGDIAVLDPDGYAKIIDRSKDIVISGGENISSIELEGVIQEHPAVLAAAVVAKKDEKWGEVPFAFVELHKGKAVSAEEILELCDQRLPRFKQPKGIAFQSLPRTSTGKVTKGQLRALVNES